MKNNQGVVKNVVESVGAFQIDLKFESVGFRGQGKPIFSEKKPSQSQG